MDRTQSLSPLLEEGPGPEIYPSRGELELAREMGLRQSGNPRTSLPVDGRSLQGLGGPKFGACYLVYCFVCLALTSLLLAEAAWEAFAPSQEARLWRRRLKPWEEAVEIFVGTALCTETLILLHVLGRRRFFRDRWRVLDAAVAGLTMFCGAFFLVRRIFDEGASNAVVEDFDVPMLALRFALQPFRMFSTASMVVRASRIHQAACQAPPEPLEPVDPRKSCEGLARPILTPELAVQLREFLPCYLRFADWELAYSPSVHGTSLNTFYRQQAGANIIVVKDAHGGLFGGFVSKPWRPTLGAYGLPESFVFVARQPESAALDSTAAGNGDLAAQTTSACVVGIADMHESGGEGDARKLQSMDEDATSSMSTTQDHEHFDVYWAMPKPGRVIQWSDSKMFGLGQALLVCDDFLRGSTTDCETFGSTPLSPAGKEFVIRDFECWQIGAED